MQYKCLLEENFPIESYCYNLARDLETYRSFIIYGGCMTAKTIRILCAVSRHVTIQ